MNEGWDENLNDLRFYLIFWKLTYHILVVRNKIAFCFLIWIARSTFCFTFNLRYMFTICLQKNALYLYVLAKINLVNTNILQLDRERKDNFYPCMFSLLINIIYLVIFVFFDFNVTHKLIILIHKYSNEHIIT